jgi:methylmalonyl-CoA mutase C-terminal domain/subunit
LKDRILQGGYKVENENRKFRVLVAKPGTDGHRQGAQLVSRALMDAGMEVVYLGSYQTSESIVNAALAEDVDVVALSLLSGSHMAWFPEVANALRDAGLSSLPVIGGGTIPVEDKSALEEAGISGNFGPGTPAPIIVEHVRQKALEKRAGRKKG